LLLLLLLLLVVAVAVAVVVVVAVAVAVAVGGSGGVVPIAAAAAGQDFSSNKCLINHLQESKQQQSTAHSTHEKVASRSTCACLLMAGPCTT
jgi:hypothetical protein